MTMGLNDMTGVRQSAFRRATANILTGLLFGLVAALTLCPSPVKAWWKDDWQLRKKSTIDASGSRTKITNPIGTSTVFIRPHIQNCPFGTAQADCGTLPASAH